jgi:LCP family protein required for cell wall assembly
MASGRTYGGAVRALVALAASLSLVVAVFAGVSAVQVYAWRSVGVDTGWHGSVPEGGRGPVTGPCSSRACNYLLLGSDSRAGLSEEEQRSFGSNADIGGTARADTIMLVHTDPNLRKAIVLSFPRDLWVEIPGVGMDRINAAFEGGLEGGGAQRMTDTVANLTGLGIDGYLYVDLNGFREVVDVLGGVEMCIPAYNVNTPGYVEGRDAEGNPVQIYYEETGHIVDPLTGLDVIPGCQTLAGEQALAYVRSRHLRCDKVPDFARIGRQQQFLRAVINQMLQPVQLARAPGLVGPILANLHRNRGFLPGDLIHMIGQLRGLSTGAVEFRSVPGIAGWEGTKSVVHMDPSARRLFAAIEQGRSISDVGTQLVQTPPSEANTTVAVVDAGEPSAALEIEGVLERAGFDVTPGIVPSSAGLNGVKGAAIAYERGDESYARVVAAYFPDLPLIEVRRLGTAPVAIVVPSGYEPIEPGTGGGVRPTANECPVPTA